MIFLDNLRPKDCFLSIFGGWSKINGVDLIIVTWVPYFYGIFLSILPGITSFMEHIMALLAWTYLLSVFKLEKYSFLKLFILGFSLVITQSYSDPLTCELAYSLINFSGFRLNSEAGGFWRSKGLSLFGNDVHLAVLNSSLFSSLNSISLWAFSECEKWLRILLSIVFKSLPGWLK